MTSISSFIRRVRKTRFIDDMEELGFHMGGERLWFYRTRGEFIDSIRFQVLAGGKGMRVHVSTYIPEIVLGYDMTCFPVGFVDAIGNISFKYLTRNGIAYGGGDWGSVTDDELFDSLSKILVMVKGDLNDWFESINTRKDLYDSIHDNVKYNNGDYSLLLERVLLS